MLRDRFRFFLPRAIRRVADGAGIVQRVVPAAVLAVIRLARAVLRCSFSRLSKRFHRFAASPADPCLN
jgi:hypothetical protein